MKKTILLTLTSVGLMVGAGMACAGAVGQDINNVPHLQLYATDNYMMYFSANNQATTEKQGSQYLPNVRNIENVKANNGGKVGKFYVPVTVKNNQFYTADGSKGLPLTVIYNGVKSSVIIPKTAFQSGKYSTATAAVHTQNDCGTAYNQTIPFGNSLFLCFHSH